jgi:hypothetical protein
MKCQSCKRATDEEATFIAFDEKDMLKKKVCLDCKLTKKHLVNYPVKGLHYGDNS